ncbi:MAG: hypothetical protein HYR94_27940 [Chloroflexi bacterium]|nr:hypothetical protein [Chloroflexota bacterium]
MTLVTIRQTAGLSDSPNAAVAFDHQGSGFPITISDSFTEAEEARLRWYFEKHLKFPFTRQIQAREAAQSITTWLMYRTSANRVNYRYGLSNCRFT